MRKSSVVRLFAAVFALGALFTAYTQFGNQPSKLNTIKLKDDLYVIHNDFVPGNTTVLVTNDGLALGLALYSGAAAETGHVGVAAGSALAALALAGTSPLQAAVIVSSKLSSESAMIGQMIRLLLNADGIQTVDRMTLGATPVVRKALISGEIDIYVEYTGNAGFFFNDAADPAWKDLARGYALGSRLDYAANRIVWLTAAPASNAWALAVRRDVALANHLRTMSDFGRWVASGGKVVLACSAEFANAGTLRSLEKTYGFTLRSDQLIVLAGGETSATIRAAAAGTNEVIREAVLRAHPQIAQIVKPLMESFDRATLQKLNERVQIDGESDEEVASDYLKAKGFLPP